MQGGVQPRPEATRPPGPPPTSVSALSGDLACVSCGYNLRGLSIREACPECGIAVRATILATIDPRADELTPIRRPRVVLAGLMAWAWGGLLASAAVWAIRLGDVVQFWRPVAWPSRWLSVWAVVFAWMSAAGALALVRPHGRLGRRRVGRAALGVLAYAPLLGVLMYTLLEHDAISGRPLDLMGGTIDVTRTQLRLGLWISVAGILLGLRDNVHVLMWRTYLMRTGHVDTQPVSALLAAVLVAAVGDGVALGGAMAQGLVGEVAASIDLVAVAVGSFLLLVGLSALSIDVWRARLAVLRKPIGLADVFDDASGAPR